MSNILITGGAGYIGSHIVELLIKNKKKVIILDNLKTGYKSLINKKADFIKLDLSPVRKIETGIIKKIIKKNNIDLFFLLWLKKYVTVANPKQRM